MIDITGNLLGKLAITGTATNDHLALGVYTGEGGRGADTTISGLAGKDAADGDLIWVRTYGAVDAKTDDGGVSTDIEVGNVLVFDDGTDGLLVSDGDAGPVESVCNFIALEAQTAGPTGTAVFVRCM
jgi:hypothetical protein